jgi:hypothetical protein
LRRYSTLEDLAICLLSSGPEDDRGKERGRRKGAP